MSWLASRLTPGMPNVISGYSAERLNQNSSWTSAGYAEEPVTYMPSRGLDHRVSGELHHGQDHAQGDAGRHADDGQHQRDANAVDDCGVPEVQGHLVPAKARVSHGRDQPETTTAVTAAAATQRHGCRAVTTVYSPLVLVVFERLMMPLIGRHPRRPGPR